MLPACIRVPKIKSIHETTIFTESDIEQQSGPIVFNARKLTAEETITYVGLSTQTYNLGNPWFVSFVNTGNEYFYITNTSWNPLIVQPTDIIGKFHDYCCFYISPFKKGIYLINHDELQQLLTTLHENLLPFSTTLYPDCRLEGIIFLPESASLNPWYVNIYNIHNNVYTFTVHSENIYLS